jgi:hypothetical protein
MSTQIVRVMICIAVSVVLPSSVQALPILWTVQGAQSGHWHDAASQENAALSGPGFRGDWNGAISTGGRTGAGWFLGSANLGSFGAGSVATQSGSVATFPGALGLGTDGAFAEQALSSPHFNESVGYSLVDQAVSSRIAQMATSSRADTSSGIGADISSRIGNGVVTGQSVESSTAQVPEPGTAFLFAAGALVLWRKYPKLRHRRGSTKQP